MPPENKLRLFQDRHEPDTYFPEGHRFHNSISVLLLVIQLLLAETMLLRHSLLYLEGLVFAVG